MKSISVHETHISNSRKHTKMYLENKTQLFLRFCSLSWMVSSWSSHHSPDDVVRKDNESAKVKPSSFVRSSKPIVYVTVLLCLLSRSLIQSD